MATLNIVIVWQSRAPMAIGYGDFSALYTAGLMERRGLGPKLYDRHEQWRVQQEFASGVTIRQAALPYIRPPFEALVFVPLSYFAYPTALAIWSTIKLALLWFTFWIFPYKDPFVRIYPAWFATILSYGFFPVFLDLYQGQDVVLLLLVVVLALRSLYLNHDRAAGLFLGLGLFKFHLVIPIVIVLVLVGRARVLAGFIPTALALIAVSCAVAGPGVLYAYPVYLLDLNRTPLAGMATPPSMPNLRGMLTALVGKAPYPGPIHWLLLPTAVAALTYTARLWRSKVQAGLPALALGYCLAIAVAILTSYYSYSYDMTLLIMPLLLVGGNLLESHALTPRSRYCLTAASLLLLCAPLYWALILHGNRPYLLCLPTVLLAAGLIGALKGMGLASVSFTAPASPATS